MPIEKDKPITTKKDEVTEEQQALLERFMNIARSKRSGNSTGILRKQRDEAGEYNRNKQKND